MTNRERSMQDVPATAYARSREWLLDALAVDPEAGLSTAQVDARRVEYGANAIGTGRRTSYWRILLNQFRGAIIWLLIAAAALSLWLGDTPEAIAIAVVLVVNTAIGFVTETRAATSMDALRELTRTTARVRRAGRELRVDAEDLVPGDIVVLEAGDIVPADLRLIEAVDLNADESTLTGESVPVAKSTDALGGTLPLADRRNMVFRGSSITRGSATGVTTATGLRTQLGEIAELVATAEGETTPLERRLDRLGRNLAVITLAVSAAIAAIGFLVGRPLFAMIETAIALAVAAVPEGLPIVATLALARGMWRMAARNVLINRLSAVETLGSATVLLTDKTGTLTENRMAVAQILLADTVVDMDAGAGDRPPQLAAALRVMALCNDAVLGATNEHNLGDPMEIALLRAARDLGTDPAGLKGTIPRRSTVAFDPEAKMMATLDGTGSDAAVHVKGAPEAVLAASASVLTAAGISPLTPELRRDLEARVDAAGEAGLRLLGLAERAVPADSGDVYRDLTLIGFVGLRDPARTDVPAAIADCQSAGVRVIMVTGDHKVTARKIAHEVGLIADGEAHVSDGADLARLRDDDTAAAELVRTELLRTNVFARVPPREKLTLVALHQQAGAVVAMTGDGVNDAPALRKADIGIAMGRRGTQVAAEASDVILRDDSFGSIVEAMRQGRIIYGNIRAFVRYLFTCNLSEIVLVALATASGMPMPLTPLQILFLNLVTDIFPAIALGFGEGPRNVMRTPPRRADEPLITRRTWTAIVVQGLLIGLCVLGAFVLELARVGEHAASGAAFLTLCIAQLFFVFAIYRPGEKLLFSQITRNGYVWAAVILSAAMMLAGVFVPALSEVLRLSPPDPQGWGVILVASALPAALTAMAKAVVRSR